LALNLEILVVSQFTLYAFLKGNKPDFHLAMGGDEARHLFDMLVEELKKGHVEDKIQTGVFGAMMKVQLENDGPVTIELESSEFRPKKKE
jgi:D-tyrosyl-tRNA(Tyr) deacylase